MLVVRFIGRGQHVGAMLESNHPNYMKPNWYEGIHAWLYLPESLDNSLIALIAIDL